MIQVFLACDDDDLRSCLFRIVEDDPALECVGSMPLARALQTSADRTYGQVALVAPPIFQLEHLIEYRRAFGDAVVVLLSDDDTWPMREMAIAAGFVAICPTDAMPDGVSEIIKRCAAGKDLLLDDPDPSADRLRTLDRMEIAAFRLAAEGWSLTDVSSALGITREELHSHTADGLRKWIFNAYKRSQSGRIRPVPPLRSPFAPDLETGSDDDPLPAPVEEPVASVSGPIRVMVITRDHLLRAGLIAVLASSPDLDVLDGYEIPDVRKLGREEIPADVVVCDLAMGENTWGALARMLEKSFPNVPVVALTETEADDELFTAVRHGVAGCIGHGTEQAAIVETVRRAAAGAYVLAEQALGRKQIAAWVLADFYSPGGARRSEPFRAFSHEDLAMLELLARGMSPTEAGNALGLSTRSLYARIASIVSKLLRHGRDEGPDSPGAGIPRRPRIPPGYLREAIDPPREERPEA
jgi:two-component system nitrate/nitrite response regulator NarL